MRIISGRYRGRIINPPVNFGSRPTTDFAKESLFNIVGNMYNFENIDVLDLFSGTGSITYEFCSRGVRSATAVESNGVHYDYIVGQIAELGFEQARPVKADVFKFLDACVARFDIIFADPPYNMKDIERIYRLVIDNQLLTDVGTLVIEHSAANDFSTRPHFTMLRKYGSVNFSFFEV